MPPASNNDNAIYDEEGNEIRIPDQQVMDRLIPDDGMEPLL